MLGKGKRKAQASAETIGYDEVHRELAKKGVTLALLWQEGMSAGDWSCSYGNFCRRYNQWKGRHNLSMRQIHKPGDKLFVDYSGLTVPVTEPSTGKVTQAEIFVACFGASNYTYAEANFSGFSAEIRN